MSDCGTPARFERAFFARPAEQVARALLGVRLVSSIGGEIVAGRIVETEAYIGPHDPASHAAERIGRTVRNRAMFGEPGTAYVYRIHGHWCLNVVSDAAGFPAAVLVRAIAPLEGLPLMRSRRWPARGPGRDRDIGRGPGNLTRALAVTGEHDTHSLDAPPIWLEPDTAPDAGDIVTAPRVGVTRAVEWPLRFYVRGDPHVSRR